MGQAWLGCCTHPLFCCLDSNTLFIASSALFSAVDELTIIKLKAGFGWEGEGVVPLGYPPPSSKLKK
jgi:hypothetical protein